MGETSGPAYEPQRPAVFPRLEADRIRARGPAVAHAVHSLRCLKRGCSATGKNGTSIPFRRDTWSEGCEVRTGNVQQW